MVQFCSLLEILEGEFLTISLWSDVQTEMGYVDG